MKKEYEDLKILLMASKFYWNRVAKINDNINLLNNSTYFYINKNILNNMKDDNRYDLIILSTGKRFLLNEKENLKNMIIDASEKYNKIIVALYNYVLTKSQLNNNCSKKLEIYVAIDGEIVKDENITIDDENFNIEELLSLSLNEYNKTLTMKR